MGRELVTPLNRLMSLVRLLVQVQPAPDQQRIAREICGSAEALVRLLNDVIDFAESEERTRTPASIAFDLRLLVDEVASWLRLRAGKRDVTVEYRVHHEVPSCLLGDAGRVRQVLWNIGALGIDALASGGLVLRVGRLQESSTQVTLRFDMCQYSSAQSGAGAAGPGPADAPPAGEEGDGGDAGVRLAIARRIAGWIGGTLSTECPAGGPAHTWVDLTFEKQAELPADETPASPRESLAGVRILVVGPEEVMRQSLVTTLAGWGCRMSEAADAAGALAQVREAGAAGDPFGFVLVEPALPQSAAHELGATLTSGGGGAAPRLVLLAAAGRRGDLERARSSGFRAYLPVPIDWQMLGEALTEVERLAASAPGDGIAQLVTRHWLAELHRRRTRLLIVEDDVVSALVTDWTLRRMGYQVRRLGTADGLRALLREAPGSFDLAIVAVRLADADGIALIRELRETLPGERDVTIVSIGFSGTRVERERCHAAGADAYIASPVDLGHLCELVERMTRTGGPSGPGPAEFEGEGTRLASVRERAQALGMITFQFDVDAESGLPLAPLAGLDLPVPEDSGPLMVARAEPAPPAAAADAVTDPPAAPATIEAGEAVVALDFARLDRTSMGNAAVRSRLLTSYVTQARAGLARIGAAVATGDAARIASESDAVARLSELVGATGCGARFGAMHRAFAGGAHEEVARQLRDAAAELERVESVIARLEVSGFPDDLAAA